MDRLTEKQRAILHALFLRTPIKKIAADRMISPSTVNEHIRAAKQKLGAASTQELMEIYYGLQGYHANSAEKNAPEDGARTTPIDDTGPKNRVHHTAHIPEKADRDHRNSFLLNDTMTAMVEAPWATQHEPSVVPEELDGPHGLLPRLVTIAKIVLAIFAAVTLALTALQSLSGVLEDRQVASVAQI